MINKVNLKLNYCVIYSIICVLELMENIWFRKFDGFMSYNCLHDTWSNIKNMDINLYRWSMNEEIQIKLGFFKHEEC